MVWLYVPVLVATISDGDGSASHEKQSVAVAVKNGWTYLQVSLKKDMFYVPNAPNVICRIWCQPWTYLNLQKC